MLVQVCQEPCTQHHLTVLFGFSPPCPAPVSCQAKLITEISGGWKMKLALARAMLLKADILLLDEPTNHLDTTNVAWLEDYLVTQPTITCMTVSHDRSAGARGRSSSSASLHQRGGAFTSSLLRVGVVGRLRIVGF